MRSHLLPAHTARRVPHPPQASRGETRAAPTPGEAGNLFFLLSPTATCGCLPEPGQHGAPTWLLCSHFLPFQGLTQPPTEHPIATWLPPRGSRVSAQMTLPGCKPRSPTCKRRTASSPGSRRGPRDVAPCWPSSEPCLRALGPMWASGLQVVWKDQVGGLQCCPCRRAHPRCSG